MGVAAPVNHLSCAWWCRNARFTTNRCNVLTSDIDLPKASDGVDDVIGNLGYIYGALFLFAELFSRLNHAVLCLRILCVCGCGGVRHIPVCPLCVYPSVDYQNRHVRFSKSRLHISLCAYSMTDYHNTMYLPVPTNYCIYPWIIVTQLNVLMILALHAYFSKKGRQNML